MSDQVVDDKVAAAEKAFWTAQDLTRARHGLIDARNVIEDEITNLNNEINQLVRSREVLEMMDKALTRVLYGPDSDELPQTVKRIRDAV